MAELRQRPNAVEVGKKKSDDNSKVNDEVAEETSSTGSSSPIPSAVSSSNDIKGLEAKATGKRTTLEERSKIPSSFYVTALSITLLQGFSGMWRYESLRSWVNSMTTAFSAVLVSASSAGNILRSLADGNYKSPGEYVSFVLAFLSVALLVYVFIVAPFRAGVWTGQRATRHKVHRYMGLAFMIQYAMAWVEFLTNYEQATTSYLPVTVALNGIIQGYSAYFSFKVLPELTDPGYFSDKAVMSRSFVHENIYFSLMCIFGSSYYNPVHRAILRTNLPGRFVEFVFVFFPFIVVRPNFPITRFKDTGTTYKGRSDKNKRFYEIGTTMVKIFYLWAKYFLGFFVNFMVYLDLATPTNWKFIHGIFLLNEGTVSLAMFLHTLRFKKILPAKFTFSLYLMQIYASFAGIPMAMEMFRTHTNLCFLCLAGLLANMTRNRKIHAVWCVIALILMTQFEIEW